MIHRTSLIAAQPLNNIGVRSRATRTRPQQAFLSILLIAGIALVLCLYLYQTTQTTVKNHNIYNLQQDYIRLQHENSNLLAIYAYEQSISQMTKRAKTAGYQPTTAVYYLPLETEPALDTVALYTAPIRDGVNPSSNPIHDE